MTKRRYTAAPGGRALPRSLSAWQLLSARSPLFPISGFGSRISPGGSRKKGENLLKGLVNSFTLRLAALGLMTYAAICLLGPADEPAYATHTPYLSLTTASVEAITVPGLVPGPYNLGTYVSGGDYSGISQPDAWGFQTGGTTVPASANALDHKGVFYYALPVVWDLGSAQSSALLFPIIDHGPIPNEGVEVTVWGSNNASDPFPGAWTIAELTTIYADGWVDVGAAQESDDMASLWTFGSGTYRYVAVYANRSVEFTPDSSEYDDCPSEPGWCSEEAEIDGRLSQIQRVDAHTNR